MSERRFLSLGFKDISAGAARSVYGLVTLTSAPVRAIHLGEHVRIDQWFLRVREMDLFLCDASDVKAVESRTACTCNPAPLTIMVAADIAVCHLQPIGDLFRPPHGYDVSCPGGLARHFRRRQS
jgi:hypothetical protein